MCKNREGFGWIELILLVLVTYTLLWPHFEAKSWDSFTEAPTLFLYTAMAGLLACGYVAVCMYQRRRSARPRREHSDLSPNDWRDELL